MATWTKVKLGDVVQINNATIKKRDYFDNIEYVDISSVGTGKLENLATIPFSSAPSRAKRIIKDGDTIISTVRPNRKSYLYIKNPPKNRIVSTGFAVLTPKLIDKRFLYYVISQQEFTDYLAKNAKGAAYPAVDEGIISRAEVILPELSAQQKIGEILATYDDLIVNNEKRIRILEEMAQRLYTEWFVKFKFPGHEKAKMVDSGAEYGMIPEGWGVERLGDIADLIMGQSPTSNYYNLKHEGLPFHQGVADFGYKYPVDRVYSTSGNKYAENYDLIFSVRAPVGQMNIANKKIILGRGLCAIRHKQKLQTLLYLMFASRFTKKDMIGNGAIYKAVNKIEIENLKFVYPKSEIAQNFEDTISKYFGEIQKLTTLNINLSKIRDILISQLVTGKRDLR